MPSLSNRGRRMWWFALLCLPLGWALLVLPSWRRPELGLSNGRLRACPDTPNCVCSEGETGEHSIEPLELRGEPAEQWKRLAGLVIATPGANMVVQEANYMRTEFVTPLMRFVDDVEFRLDGNRVHVRSASRVGRSDLGANRNRVEKLRRALNGAEPAQ